MAGKLDASSNVDLTEDDEEVGWIVTFADLTTLLLVFFVLLYSLSAVDLERFRQVAESLRASLGDGYFSGQGQLMEASEADPAPEPVTIADYIGMSSGQEDLLEEFQDFIDAAGFGGDIIVRRIRGRILIQIAGTVLFNSGAAELNVQAEPVLNKIVLILRQHPEFQVNIKGHTDNMPIATPQFPSNWDLSAIRATTVLKYLIRHRIDAHRLTATGYGDLIPLMPNTTETNRAKNRRVEFVLEKKNLN